MDVLSTWATHLVSLFIGAASAWVALRRSKTDRRKVEDDRNIAANASAKRWSLFGIRLSKQIRADNDALRAEVELLRAETAEWHGERNVMELQILEMQRSLRDTPPT